MPHRKFGAKHRCPECNTAFYDLQHSPVTCPHCQHGFTPVELEDERPHDMPGQPHPERDEAARTLVAIDETLDEESREYVRRDADEIPEIDDNNPGEIEEIEIVEGVDDPYTHSASDDDADDESIIEQMGDARPGISLLRQVDEDEEEVING